MSDETTLKYLKTYRIDEVIRQVIDFRGRTPLKIGMEWGGGDIRALSANNVQMGYIDFNKESHLGSEALYQKWMNKGECEKGDVLFTTEAPLGNIAQIPDNKKYILSQRTILLKSDRKKASPDYLAQLFQSKPFQTELIRHSTGTTVVGIQQARLAKIQIDLPPLPEQKKIARILTTVDNLIEKTEELIEKYKAIKQGMMHDLFTRGVDQNGKLRPPYEEAPHLYKESALGWIPKEWEVDVIQNVIKEFVNGYAFKSDSYLEHSDYPIIRMSNISLDGQFMFDEISAKYCSGSEYRRLKRFHVSKDDLIIAMTDVTPDQNLIGRAAIVDVDVEQHFILNQRVGLIRCDEERISRWYLQAFTNTIRFRSYSIRRSAASAQANLGTKDICNGMICVPQLSEQERIVNCLRSLDENIAVAEQENSKNNLLKTGLMQDLLTGKVRVKVDEAEEELANA